MSKHNENNERAKRKYFIYLKDAQGYCEQTIDAVAKALSRFEADTNRCDFKKFRSEQAIAFKRRLTEQRNVQTGEKLSKATAYSTLANLTRFFYWLAREPGYKSKIRYSDADFFKLSAKDVRVATARREQPVPTMEQIKHVIEMSPSETGIEKRNRAMIAFTLLTSPRDSAIASMKLKHVDIEAGLINQDAREVKTKFSKTFTTYFFPVGDEIRAIVVEWVRYLRNELLWGDDDPLFPATEVVRGSDGLFEVFGLRRECWSNAGPIRKIFRESFERAGLPYFNPHSFRHTLTQLGMKICRSPEEIKAWSQNLGHENVATTFTSYGTVAGQRQSEIMRDLCTPRSVVNNDVQTFANELMAEILGLKVRADALLELPHP